MLTPDSGIRLLEPYCRLAKGNARAEDTIFIPSDTTEYCSDYFLLKPSTKTSLSCLRFSQRLSRRRLTVTLSPVPVQQQQVFVDPLPTI